VPFLQAAAVAVLLSALARRGNALQPGGALGAAAIGTAILAAGGWPGGLVLLAFFLPASALSRLWPGPSSSLDPKGDRRDARQVLANGAAPALALLIGGPGAHLGLATGLAAAAADTFATTVGAHSRQLPRHILDGRRVPRGTSGGITALGTLGGGAGALLVSLAALPLVGWRGSAAALTVGFAGMLLDSALGAAVQGRFQCDRCQLASEWRTHRCGAATRHVGGVRWLDNDGVNAVATGAATAAGCAIWAWCCAA